MSFEWMENRGLFISLCVLCLFFVALVSVLILFGQESVECDQDPNCNAGQPIPYTNVQIEPEVNENTMNAKMSVLVGAGK